MRIAMLAPIAWRTPPRHYGPWELVTSLLTEALVRKGVDVTLFATLDSITTAKLAGVVPAGYSEDPDVDAKVWEMRHLSHLFEQADQFDLTATAFGDTLCLLVGCADQERPEFLAADSAENVATANAA